jgi:hypothetical protein
VGFVSTSARRSCSISLPGTGSSNLTPGGVSERPKEHASKACVGETPPWVQIPPPPRLTCGNAGPALLGRAGIFVPSLNSCLSLLRMILMQSLFIKVPRRSGSFAPVRLCPLTVPLDGHQSWAGTASTVVQRRSAAFVNDPKVHASPACTPIAEEGESRKPADATLSSLTPDGSPVRDRRMAVGDRSVNDRCKRR